MLLIAGLAAPSAAAGDKDDRDRDRVTVSEEPRCDPPTTLRQMENEEDPAARRETMGWLGEGDGGEEFSSDVEEQFAAATTAVDDLGEQFLGGYVDLDDRAYVYVTDPAAEVDAEEVAEQLAAATERGRFRVEPGCRSREQLQRIVDEVTSFASQKDWEHDGLGVGIDPASGTVEVTIGGGDRSGMAAELEDRYDAQVTVVVDEGAMAEVAGSRNNDVSPHHGGARISAVGRGNCTSGFAVDLPGGPRIMTTAAHCANNVGALVRNGQGARFGTIRHRSFPSGDVATIHDPAVSTRAYHRFVWESATSRRIVTSKRANPFDSMAVCLSGATSVNLECGLTVARNQTFCRPDNGPCTPGLYRAAKADQTPIVRGGDSGGPVIGRTAPGEVQARGQIVGGRNCTPPPSGGPQVCPISWQSPIQLLETQLQVRIATQPGLEW